MVNPRKIILHSLNGYRPELDAMIAHWIRERIEYVGIVGVDVATVHRAFETALSSAYHPALHLEGPKCSDGSDYFMYPMAHDGGESLQDAVDYATRLAGYFAGPVTDIVEF